MGVSIGVCYNQLMRRSCRIYLEVSPDVRREAEHDGMMHADRNFQELVVSLPRQSSKRKIQLRETPEVGLSLEDEDGPRSVWALRLWLRVTEFHTLLYLQNPDHNPGQNHLSFSSTIVSMDSVSGELRGTIQDWDESDVQAWLTSLGYSQYEHQIRGMLSFSLL